MLYSKLDYLSRPGWLYSLHLPPAQIPVLHRKCVEKISPLHAPWKKEPSTLRTIFRSAKTQWGLQNEQFSFVWSSGSQNVVSGPVTSTVSGDWLETQMPCTPPQTYGIRSSGAGGAPRDLCLTSSPGTLMDASSWEQLLWSNQAFTLFNPCKCFFTFSES